MTRPEIEALIANDEQAAKVERIIMAGLQSRMDEFNNLPRRPSDWANGDPNAPFPDGEASTALIRDVRCYFEARDNAARFDKEAAALRELLEEVERLRGAALPLLEAVELADQRGDLDDLISGDLQFALRSALETTHD